MLDDPNIFSLIKRYKNICKILNELKEKNREGKRSKPFRYLFLLDEPPYINPQSGKRHPYVCFITNKNFYDSIIPKLGIARNTLQKYLMAFCKVGVIKKLNKAGRSDISTNQKLYALGYSFNYKGSPSLKTFLIKENKEEFAKFKLP
ncbi:MAG: hypothetical protein A4E71_01757 [Smithella sp. PtaU1.Bin162]|nr:MAG: hypothetical protein A4E71_01757 [Smithella sp. PtaU1.Bin162]